MYIILICYICFFFFFFFNDTATTEIYTLSLHDALPICFHRAGQSERPSRGGGSGTPHLGHGPTGPTTAGARGMVRSEEHTSELQSQSNLVCRLLLEKKKKKITETHGQSRSIITEHEIYI